MFWVYVLANKSCDHYYVGQTNDLPSRVRHHSQVAMSNYPYSGHGRRWMQEHGLDGVCCFMEARTRSEALCLEWLTFKEIQGNGFMVNGVTRPKGHDDELALMASPHI